MLRDKNLVPLSRQHQHALALCVRLDRALRAKEIELNAWQAEIAEIFQQEIAIHFEAEEKHLFPAAMKYPQLCEVTQELIGEHARLRWLFAEAKDGKLDRKGLEIFARLLAEHIRKEERQLFEGMQKVMSTGDLAEAGLALQRELGEARQVCTVPGEATKLRPKA